MKSSRDATDSESNWLLERRIDQNLRELSFGKLLIDAFAVKAVGNVQA